MQAGIDGSAGERSTEVPEEAGEHLAIGRATGAVLTAEVLDATFALATQRDHAGPYTVDVQAMQIGSFDVGTVTCEAAQVEYETRWSEPHRTVFSAVELVPAEVSGGTEGALTGSTYWFD